MVANFDKSDAHNADGKALEKLVAVTKTSLNDMQKQSSSFKFAFFSICISGNNQNYCTFSDMVPPPIISFSFI